MFLLYIKFIIEYIYTLLQYDINADEKWYLVKNMSLNLSKCSVTFFYRIKEPKGYFYSISNVMLPIVQYFKDLGVTFLSDLNFNHHIFTIINQAARQLGFIRRIVITFITL